MPVPETPGPVVAAGAGVTLGTPPAAVGTVVGAVVGGALVGPLDVGSPGAAVGAAAPPKLQAVSVIRANRSAVYAECKETRFTGLPHKPEIKLPIVINNCNQYDMVCLTTQGGKINAVSY
jgi:hypothetical protein